MNYCYSPRPMPDYRIAEIPQDTVAWISSEDLAPAIWNLYWLSEPSLDCLPESDIAWRRHFRPHAGGLAAAIADVNDDYVLYSKLMLPPAMFLRWFELEDVSIFDCYTAFGEQAWVDRVLDRAQQAVIRNAVPTSNNVVHIDFRRRA